MFFFPLNTARKKTSLFWGRFLLVNAMTSASSPMGISSVEIFSAPGAAGQVERAKSFFGQVLPQKDPKNKNALNKHVQVAGSFGVGLQHPVSCSSFLESFKDARFGDFSDLYLARATC